MCFMLTEIKNVYLKYENVIVHSLPSGLVLEE